MKNQFLSCLAGLLCLCSMPAFSQSDKDKAATKDTVGLGLPGDGLDLYATLDLFQKSKTIEEFEKNLNLEKTGINNLDLNLDKKVDFIKVVTTKKDDDFTFVLQVHVTEKETQDVAVILLTKDKDKKINLQIVGDEDLYGKNYIVELKETSTPAKTPNPAYTGPDPDTVYVPASTQTVVVQQAPIVQYVYSPAYVPYYPPYYYGYYPPYFTAFAAVSIGFYWGAHAHYHGGYHGGYHGNTTVIHNTNNFNNYNNNRNTSNTVNHNRQDGGYSRDRNNASTRPSTGAGGGRGQSGAGGARPSTQPAGGRGPEAGGSGARPSTQPSGGRGGDNSFSGSSRPSTQPANSNFGNSNRSSGGSSYNRSSGGSRGSGGYSGGGGSRGGGGFSGGGGRGGGGRGGGGRR